MGERRKGERGQREKEEGKTTEGLDCRSPRGTVPKARGGHGGQILEKGSLTNDYWLRYLRSIRRIAEGNSFAQKTPCSFVVLSEMLQR